MSLLESLAEQVSKGIVSEAEVRSLEEQLEVARLKINEEFAEIVGSQVGEIQSAVVEGLELYITNSFHDERYHLEDTLPHFKSDFTDQAKEYVKKVGSETLFGAKLILRYICEFFHVYGDNEGNLSDTAFEDSEEVWNDEYEHLPFQSLYAKEMSKGEHEIVECDGKPMLKIYRGLEVPARDITSEGDDREREAGVIDLTYPGTDWSPIRNFAEGYSEGILISALVPMDDPDIIEASISHCTLDYEWHGQDTPKLKNMMDFLMVEVPERKYHVLKDVKLECAEGSFEVV